MAESIGRKNFILERASIDELFIDVTAFCYRSVSTDKSNHAKERETASTTIFRSECDNNSVQSLEETMICHDAYLDSGEKIDEIGKALRLGCHVAATARRAVLEKLGFTLSAGISTNKLVSKLAASYGKPNGQAVIYPGAMDKLMEETQICKARMLGGKLGKKVSSLLPESETTMGSISRLLPLDRLEKAIGEESGRWVFDACRGIDSEKVKPTLKVLPKSITAFKSFQKLSYPELEKWTTLLVRDIMRRVEMDNARNNRIPKSCTVAYYIPGARASAQHADNSGPLQWRGGPSIGRTFRLSFPTDKDFDSRVQKLVDNTRKVLIERGNSSFVRLGFSAIDFVVRPKVGIDSFFIKSIDEPSSTQRSASGDSDGKKEFIASSGGIDSFFSTRTNQSAVSKLTTTTALRTACCGDGVLRSKTPPPKSIQERISSALLSQEKGAGTGACNWLEDVVSVAETDSVDESHHGISMTDEDIARQLQKSYDKEGKKQNKNNIPAAPKSILDRDKAFALQLQSTFDRENDVLSHADRHFDKKRNNSKLQKGNKNKRGKIDYFLKK